MIENTRPGKIAQTLIEGEYANPVVVLDEVDKAGGDARYDPMGALYALLNATSFVEQLIGFIGVWLGAANAAGGYVVTERMLQMFKPSDRKQDKKQDQKG